MVAPNVPAVFDPQDHQHYTTPPTGVLQTTHAAGEENRVWVIPLDLKQPVLIRRATAIIGRLAGSGNPIWSLAIYKATLSERVNRLDPTSRTRAQKLSLVLVIGGGTVAVSNAKRLDLDLGKDLRLDPAVARYFLGYTVSDAACAWLCANEPDFSSVLCSFKTRPGAASAGLFPQTILPVDSLNRVPSIVLRSSLGAAIFGDLGAATTKISPPGGGGGGGGGGGDLVFACTGSVSVGDAVYETSTPGTVDQAKADAAGTMPVIGFCVSKLSATSCTVRRAGELDGYAGLVAGTVYMVSKSTAGGITATTPTRPAFVQRVAVARATDTIEIFCDPSVYELSS